MQRLRGQRGQALVDGQIHPRQGAYQGGLLLQQRLPLGGDDRHEGQPPGRVEAELGPRVAHEADRGEHRLHLPLRLLVPRGRLRPWADDQRLLPSGQRLPDLLGDERYEGV